MSTRLKSGLLFAACLCAAAVLGGCGCNGPERVVVSGTITYRGQPIPDGQILFVPLPSCPVPTAMALIVNGQYKADHRGGVPVGTHTVRIEAYRAPPPSTNGAMAMPGARDQYLPARHNTASQVQMTIEPGSRAITKDFNLND